MPNLGVPELILIFIIILVLFGGKKIPELTRSIGDSIRQFKLGIDGDKDKKETNAPVEKGKVKKA